MDGIEIRYQQIRDAKVFWQILNEPGFEHFPVRPKTIAAEREFLRQTQAKRKSNTEHNFAITLYGEVIGAVGVMIDARRPHIGEIGYFVTRAHWGKGIASQAVGLVEDFARSKLRLHRIEIGMIPANTASRRVAERCGYEHEGTLRDRILMQDGRYEDVRLYAKILAAPRPE